MSIKKRNRILQKYCWVPVLLLVPVISLASDTAATEKAIPSKNVTSALDDYYKEVNKQLDKRLDHSRQPFSVDEQASKEPEGAFLSSITSSLKNTTKRAGNILPSLSSSLPGMSVKGYVERSGSRAAMLEIESLGVFFVEKGDKVGLQKATGIESALHVIEINELNVILSIGETGQHIVVQ